MERNTIKKAFSHAERAYIETLENFGFEVEKVYSASGVKFQYELNLDGVTVAVFHYSNIIKYKRRFEK